MTEMQILSNFDTHVFLCNYTDQNTIPANGQEVEDVIECTPPEINKDTKTYKTLTNNGWNSVAVLGQEVGDIPLSFVRQAEGIYTGTGTTNTDAYCVLKKWFDGSLGAGQGAQIRNLIIVKPRKNSGVGAYEGTMYHVMPKTWSDGNIDPDTGQEFNLTLAVFGAPMQVEVTAQNNNFSFAAIQSE